jgi:hypothetical protein
VAIPHDPHEPRAHLAHRGEAPRDGLLDAGPHPRTILVRAVHRVEQPLGEVRLVDGQAQLGLPPVGHQVHDALVHRDPDADHPRRHRRHQGVVPRRHHQVRVPDRRHHREHVPLVGGHDADALSEAVPQVLARAPIELLHRHARDEHVVAAAVRAHRRRERLDVPILLCRHLRAAGVEVDGRVVLVGVRSEQRVGGPLHDVGLHGPPERVDRAHDEHRPDAVPPGLSQDLGPHVGRRRLERPRGVRADVGRDAEATEHPDGRLVARDDPGAFAVPSDQILERRVHRAGLAAVRDRELALREREPERTGHHRRQRVRELRLEHRAFARDHAVLLVHGVEQELREDLRQFELLDRAEVASGQRRVVGQDREVEVVVAEQVPELADHLLDAHVRAGVPRARVAREQQLQRLPRGPLRAGVDRIAGGGRLDQPRHRHDQRPIRVDGADAIPEFAGGGPGEIEEGRQHGDRPGSWSTTEPRTARGRTEVRRSGGVPPWISVFTVTPW